MVSWSALLLHANPCRVEGCGHGGAPWFEVAAGPAGTGARELPFVAQLDGYDNGKIKTLGLILGLAAEALLAVGGYIGGTLVFVYGNRVLKRAETPLADALVPGRAEDD